MFKSLKYLKKSLSKLELKDKLNRFHAWMKEDPKHCSKEFTWLAGFCLSFVLNISGIDQIFSLRTGDVLFDKGLSFFVVLVLLYWFFSFLKKFVFKKSFSLSVKYYFSISFILFIMSFLFYGLLVKFLCSISEKICLNKQNHS